MWVKRGMHIGFWRDIQKERDLYEDLDMGGRMLKWVSEK
jgi:hypothetical protein